MGINTLRIALQNSPLLSDTGGNQLNFHWLYLKVSLPFQKYILEQRLAVKAPFGVTSAIHVDCNTERQSFTCTIQLLSPPLNWSVNSDLHLRLMPSCYLLQTVGRGRASRKRTFPLAMSRFRESCPFPGGSQKADKHEESLPWNLFSIHTQREKGM